MESRTQLLLHEIRKSPRADQIEVIRRLLDSVGAVPPDAGQNSPTPVKLSPDEMNELRSRLERIDDSYTLPELMQALTREVMSPTARP